MAKRRKRKRPGTRQAAPPVELQGVTRGDFQRFRLIQEGEHRIEEIKRIITTVARGRPAYLWGANDRIVIDGLIESMEHLREGIKYLAIGMSKNSRAVFSKMTMVSGR